MWLSAVGGISEFNGIVVGCGDDVNGPATDQMTRKCVAIPFEGAGASSPEALSAARA